MVRSTPDYAKLAAEHIREPGQRSKRILIYGRNKQGKSWFGASAPNVLIIDPEGGAEDLPKGTKIWPVYKWQEVNGVFRYLQQGNHPFEWVCLDGLTRLSNMSLRFVMKQAETRDLDRIPGMVQQRDYGKAGELMKGMLFNFHNLPMGIVYTAQDRMESSVYDQEDEDVEDVAVRFVPDLPKGVRSSLNAIVDVIGRIYTVKIEGKNSKGVMVKGRQRRLWISPTEQFDTGYRTSAKGIPPYLAKPTVPALVELLKGKEAK